MVNIVVVVLSCGASAVIIDDSHNLTKELVVVVMGEPCGNYV